MRTGLLLSTQGTPGPGLFVDHVADVIQAIDGPVTVTACSTEKNDCASITSATCGIRCPQSGSAWRADAPHGESC